MTHNTTYSDESVRACSNTIRNYFTNMHHERTTSAALLSAMLEQDFAASAAQPGIWRCAADQHRYANSSTARGAPRTNVVGITTAGSVLEGAASKAHLSPMHGTRAALELHPGSRMADTEKRCENSRTVQTL